MKDTHLDYCVELKVTHSQIIQYSIKVYCKNKIGTGVYTTNFKFVKKIKKGRPWVLQSLQEVLLI
jgi:hypothetical protein